MFDRQIVQDASAIVLESIALIEERMELIAHAPDFVGSKEGRTIADAVLLRLQIISQKVQRIRSTAPELADQYQLDHTIATPAQYLLSMHYDEIDYELLFDFCMHQLPELELRMTALQKSLK